MNKYYNDKYSSAVEFERFVYDVLKEMGLVVIKHHKTKELQLKGENSIGWEIKHDELMIKTGNVYIEIAEKSDPRNAVYVKSGIYRDDNTWMWIIGDYEEFFIIQKNLLIMLVKTGKYRKVENERKSSIGYLVPKEVIEKYAGKVVYPEKKLMLYPIYKIAQKPEGQLQWKF